MNHSSPSGPRRCAPRALSRKRLGLACLAVAAMFGTAATVRADLHVPEPAVDLGTVYAGAPLVHEFAFVNQGPETVAILEARAGCGCLKPRFAQSAYQP